MKQLSFVAGFLDYLRPNDAIVVGRKWDILDLIAGRGAVLVAPGTGDTALSRAVQAVMANFKKFRSKLDKFRYLSGTIPHSNIPILSQVVNVACCMTNFFPNSPVKIQPPPPPPPPDPLRPPAVVEQPIDLETIELAYY